MSNLPLAIYLNDHHGLVTGELELIRRVKRENADNWLSTALVRYEEEVGHQQQMIKQILTNIGRQKEMVKSAAAWLTEKLGRFKLNDSLFTYTDLARLLEVEVLTTAAQARIDLWKTMELLKSEHREAVNGIDVQLLREQSERHLHALADHHRNAAVTAFSEMAKT